MRRWSLLLCCVFAPPALPQGLELTLQTGKHGFKDSPIRLPLQWPKDWKTPTAVELEIENVKRFVGQLTEPSFTTETIAAQDGTVRKDLVFIVSELQPDKSYAVKIAPPTGEAKASQLGHYSWKEQPGQWAEVSYHEAGGKSVPVMRYMMPTYDATSQDTINKSYKVFHHLYDPAGTRFVTNGGHTDSYTSEKDLLYPHHRGLMFAFNKITYGPGKNPADTWHCRNGEHTSHQKTLFQVAGPSMAEHRVELGWYGRKNDLFAREERQMTVYKTPGGTLVEFASRLVPTVDHVRLDGDPQHAGFQFRASNDVAKQTAKQTYYLRPDGKGKPGETRNWSSKTMGPVNLPWDVLCFVLDGKRYSAAYIDHQDNPGEKRYSERDYGRFGCYFEYDLTKDRPLRLNHRVWLQEGEMTLPQAEALRQAFVEPPRVTSK